MLIKIYTKKHTQIKIKMKDGKKEMKKLTSKQVRLMERVRNVKNKVLKNLVLIFVNFHLKIHLLICNGIKYK